MDTEIFSLLLKKGDKVVFETLFRLYSRGVNTPRLPSHEKKQ
ncbi:hypothetical protein KCTC52924_00856 [Arenibacter antarcticus]